jgi:hypothetical protein
MRSDVSEHDRGRTWWAMGPRAHAMPHRSTGSRWTGIEAVVAMGRFDALSVEDHVAVWNDTARLPRELVEAGLVRRCPAFSRTISE